MDLGVAGLAGRQHGVVALGQLRDLGLSPSAVRSRVATGRLHGLHRGVYAVGRRDVPVRGLWMAAVLACGDGAVLSRRSALVAGEASDRELCRAVDELEKRRLFGGREVEDVLRRAEGRRGAAASRRPWMPGPSHRSRAPRPRGA